MKQKTEASQAVDERAQFEREMLRLSIIDDEGLEQSSDGSYIDETAQTAWSAWQARAALKAKPAPTEAAPDLTCAILWLEAGCDPMEVALELRAYQRIMGQKEPPKPLPKAPAQAQGEDSTRLDADGIATIEEAAKVLESAAKHNEGLGRTVFAHVQRDRAVRLRAILDRARASAETGGVKP